VGASKQFDQAAVLPATGVDIRRTSGDINTSSAVNC